jgi:hypothetical protein
LGWTQPNHLGWDETVPTQLTWSLAQPSDHVNYIRVLHAKWILVLHAVVGLVTGGRQNLLGIGVASWPRLWRLAFVGGGTSGHGVIKELLVERLTDYRVRERV